MSAAISIRAMSAAREAMVDKCHKAAQDAQATPFESREPKLDVEACLTKQLCRIEDLILVLPADSIGDALIKLEIIVDMVKGEVDFDNHPWAPALVTATEELKRLAAS